MCNQLTPLPFNGLITEKFAKSVTGMRVSRTEWSTFRQHDVGDEQLYRPILREVLHSCGSYFWSSHSSLTRCRQLLQLLRHITSCLPLSSRKMLHIRVHFSEFDHCEFCGFFSPFVLHFIPLGPHRQSGNGITKLVSNMKWNEMKWNKIKWKLCEALIWVDKAANAAW